MIELPVISPEDLMPEDSSRPRFWRSAQHRDQDPEFVSTHAAELMPSAQGAPTESSRRHFLQIMGASMAMAGLSACRKPVEQILPFARKPEELIPGVPTEYATSMEFRGALRPLLVESTDGRPTKIEGNPEHPESSGSSSVFEQAALLGLYDPDRSQRVMHDGGEATWDDMVRLAGERYSRAGSEHIGVVVAPGSSMTQARLRAALEARYASVTWVEYDALGDDPSSAGLRALYGRPLRSRYDLASARVIVSLDADFLSATDADSNYNAAGFAAGRRVEDSGHMSRLYAVESGYSITGGMADHRLPLRSADIAGFAAALARKFGVAASGGSAYDSHPWLNALADDLRSAGASSVVMVGDNQPAAVHAMAMAINAALGSIGEVVNLLSTGDASPATREADLGQLVGEMRSGSIDTLLIVGCNPVFDAPASVGFVEALAVVPESVHVGLYADETAALTRWHVPQAHFLEAWNDGRAFGGTQSVVQPLIAPLFESAHSGLEVLGLFASGIDQSGYDLVRETWRDGSGGDFEANWKRILHDGYASNTAFSTYSGAPENVAAAVGGVASVPSADDLEVVFRRSPKVLDGQFANNAWLQELPEPTTKVVWDNVAVMSPATAERLGLRIRLDGGQHFADMATVTVDGRSINIPAWIQPGVAEGSIQLELGYGRSIGSLRPERRTNLFDLDDEMDIYGQGALADGLGVNVAALRGEGTIRFAAGASVSSTGGDYLIATTQDHGTLPDEGAEVAKRGLYRMGTLEEFREHPDFVKEEDPHPIREDWPDYPAMWENNHPSKQDANKDNPYHANQWGMVIDLNACTGCNACMVACQSENNIQVVGKDQVSRGREMHWIRMDRYFVGGDGSSEAPQMVLQPVPCMHCENAPCESVCPVAATVHSPDGTNQMIYNRCIGTRYCANNCPYKVRRFNFYNWTKSLPATVQMAQNPNVTVRSRGVMEKCSYCIQRVREVNKRVNVERRTIRDGDVITACQQACPADAIVFGDLNDSTSAVSKAKQSPRRYEMLAELSVKPRTSYLGRIRNPNPALEHSA